ncbi:hypothetical protein JNW90_33585 [Micromonospora sp. STR1s_5]|nr:hypothetical protein [Micromonospora sp. STR1s_5]
MGDVPLTTDARIDLEHASAVHLPANNYVARINYAEIAVRHVVRFTDALHRSEPVFWITLISDDYTFDLDRSGEFVPFRLQQWARAVLRGCSFVGMVEAALYTNADKVRLGPKRAVSWHVHLIVWGISTEQMKALRDSINRRTSTMIPGLMAAHYRTLDRDKVEGQVLYMLKAPLNEYRIYGRKEEAADSDTGEITKVPTGRFSMKKYQLGPGDLVRMANLMAGKTLDELTFATGQGTAVLDEINYEAKARLRAAERAAAAREASRRSPATHLGPPARSRPTYRRRGPQ